MGKRKKREPEDESDDPTKEKVDHFEKNQPSGTGKTLLTSKPSKEETPDEKQRKGSLYKSSY